MTRPMTGTSPHDPPPGSMPGGLMRPVMGPKAMLFCFLAVVAAYVGLTYWGGAPGDAPQQDTGEPDPVFVPPATRADQADMAALLPEETKRRLEQELQAWFRNPKSCAIEDGNAADEAGWVEHLLDPEVSRRLARLPARVFGDLGNVPGVMDDPASARGTLVRIWGRLESSTETELVLSDGPRRAWVLSLTGATGAPWSATSLDPPPPDVQVGDWLKAYGVFVKLRSGDAAGRRSLHAFLAPVAVVRSFPPVQHREPKVEWLELIHDGDPGNPQASELDDEPFYGMLNYVRTMGIEGYKELRDGGTIELHDLTDNRASLPLIENPHRHRFAAVRLIVVPAKREFAMDGNLPENVGNIEFAYTGYGEDEQRKIIKIVSPFSNENYDVHSSRLVAVEGFFYKNLLVTGRDGKRRWFPVILATVIEPIHVESHLADLNTVLGVVVVGSVALLVLFFWLVNRNRRERDAFERRRVERKGRMRRDAGRAD